jgi:hypothetical protein
MSGYVSSVKFCQLTGTDRGNLHKRLKKEGVPTIKGPYLTESGVQDVTWIPQDWVDKVMARYAAAEAARGR